MAEDARSDADTPDDQGSEAAGELPPADAPGGQNSDAEDGAPPPDDGHQHSGGQTPELRPWGQLRRSEDDRMIAGVAGGLAEFLGISAVPLRIGFVALSLIGGAGALVYLIGWLAVPSATGPSIVSAAFSGTRRGDGGRRRWRSIAALVLICLGILITAGLSNDLLRFIGRKSWDAPVLALVLLVVGAALVLWPSQPRRGTPVAAAAPAQAHTETPAARPPDTDATASPPQQSQVRATRRRRSPSLVGTVCIATLLAYAGAVAILHGAGVLEAEIPLTLAGGLAITGISLAVSAFASPARGLLFIGAVLAAGLLVTAGSRPSWSASIGTSRVNVNDSSFDAGIGETQIRHGLGHLIVDLYDFPPYSGTHEIDVELAAGKLTVYLPDNLAATIEANVGTGSVNQFYRHSGRHHVDRREGLGVSRLVELDGGAEPIAAVELDIEVGIGSVDIDVVHVAEAEASQ